MYSHPDEDGYDYVMIDSFECLGKINHNCKDCMWDVKVLIVQDEVNQVNQVV